jgi:hypothetical protein
MYGVTTPAGETVNFVHTLEADERLNNSWVAVSHDSQWMVSGDIVAPLPCDVVTTIFRFRRT